MAKNIRTSTSSSKSRVVRSGSVVDLRKVAAKKTSPSTRPTARKNPGSFTRPATKKVRRSRPTNNKKGSKILVFLFVLLILLVTATLAGFFIFGGTGSSQSLKLGLSAPKNASSGDEVSIEITYENLDKTSLEDIQLVIQYPEGFYFDSANIQPYNPEKNLWELDDLAVGQSEKITINGQLFGRENDDQEFEIMLHYQPSNFHSDFRENISKSIKIKDELLSVNVAAPDKLNDGDPAEFSVSYKNNTAEDFSDVYFGFEFDDEAFSMLGQTPSTTEGYNWLIEEIPEQEEGELSLSGNIDGSKVNPFSWTLKAWREVNVDGQQQQRIIYQQSGEVEVVGPNLELAVETVSQAEDFNWGKTVQYKISYENTGKVAAEEAVLKLAFNDFIDWDLYDNVTGATRDNNTLIWLSKSDEATAGLSEIKPGESGELTISLPIKSDINDVAQLNSESLAVEVQAFANIKFNDSDKIFSSDKLSSPIASETTLETEARYYLDKSSAVGSGPVPPKIGQTTTYRIYWKVFSGGGGLSEATIKTTLPDYISWERVINEPTAGNDLVFDETSRQLSWEIPDLGPNTPVMASFDISVTPDESQINQLLILTNATSFNAKEKNSGSLISKTANLLTSELLGDPLVQGQGRVKLGN